MPRKSFYFERKLNYATPDGNRNVSTLANTDNDYLKINCKCVHVRINKIKRNKSRLGRIVLIFKPVLNNGNELKLLAYKTVSIIYTRRPKTTSRQQRQNTRHRVSQHRIVTAHVLRKS